MSLSIIDFVLPLTILQILNKCHPEVTELFHPKRKCDRHTDESSLLPCHAIHFTFICCGELTGCMQYFSPLCVVVNLLIVCNTFHLYVLWQTY